MSSRAVVRKNVTFSFINITLSFNSNSLFNECVGKELKLSFLIPCLYNERIFLLQNLVSFIDMEINSFEVITFLNSNKTDFVDYQLTLKMIQDEKPTHQKANIII